MIYFIAHRKMWRKFFFFIAEKGSGQMLLDNTAARFWKLLNIFLLLHESAQTLMFACLPCKHYKLDRFEIFTRQSSTKSCVRVAICGGKAAAADVQCSVLEKIKNHYVKKFFFLLNHYRFTIDYLASAVVFGFQISLSNPKRK